MFFFGTRAYGRVHNTSQSYITTHFFHVNFIPLVPLKSTLVTKSGEYKLTSIDGISVLHGYSKIAMMLVLFDVLGWMVFSGWFDGVFQNLNKAFGVLSLIALAQVALIIGVGLNACWNRVHRGSHTIVVRSS